MAKPTLTVRTVGEHEVRIHAEPVTVDGENKLKYEILSDKIVLLDHARAVSYIELPIFAGERDVIESHIEKLRDLMARGQFNENLVVLSTAELNGVTYKINGQHTAWAVFCMPPAFKLEVREIRYRVKSVEQIKQLYATYDQALARTSAHLTKLQLVNTPETEGLTSHIIQRLAPGVRFWLYHTDDERKRVSPEQLALRIRHEFADTFRRVAEFMVQYPKARILRNRPVLAAILATYHKLPTRAEEFWGPVVGRLGLAEKTDPRYVLSEQLSGVTLNAGRRTGERKQVDPETLYTICIQAWSKWRNGEAVRRNFAGTARRELPR